MIALAVGAYLKQGTLANIIFACVAVYFIARIVSVVKRWVNHGNGRELSPGKRPLFYKIYHNKNIKTKP